MIQPTTPSTDLICPFCGYNLHGTPGDRCSECGRDFDRATMSISQIPWSHRKRIGHLPAFFKTCWLVTWHPAKLAQEMNRPVSLKDALSFRRRLTLLLCLPIWTTASLALVWVWTGKAQWPKPIGWVGPFTALLGGGSSTPFGTSSITQDTFLALLTNYIRPPWSVFLLCAATAVFFWGITGAASIFVRPKSLNRESQNRAVALSYYALAPTWLLAVPLGLGILTYGLDQWWKHLGDDLPMAVHYLLGAATGISFLFASYMVWSVPWRLVRWLTHCGTGRTLWAAVGIPLSWLGMFLVALTIPLLAFFVDFIGASLQ